MYKMLFPLARFLGLWFEQPFRLSVFCGVCSAMISALTEFVIPANLKSKLRHSINERNTVGLSYVMLDSSSSCRHMFGTSNSSAHAHSCPMFVFVVSRSNGRRHSVRRKPSSSKQTKPRQGLWKCFFGRVLGIV